MKAFKQMFKTIILASIAFIISGSQMFAQKPTVYVTFYMSNQVPFAEKVMGDLMAGSSSGEATTLLGQGKEDDTWYKRFKLGTFDKGKDYFINHGQDLSPCILKDINIPNIGAKLNCANFPSNWDIEVERKSDSKYIDVNVYIKPMKTKSELK